MKKRAKLTKLYMFVAIIGISLIVFIGSLTFFGTGFRTYTNKRKHFTIKYPKKWEKNLRNTGGSVVTFRTKQANDLDYFVENVNVVVQQLNNLPMSLEDFTELSIHQMEVVFEHGMEILSSVDIPVGGLPGHKFVFLVKRPGVSDLKFHIIWAIRGPLAFQVTYVALEPAYDQYIGEVNKIFSSFKILE